MDAELPGLEVKETDRCHGQVGLFQPPQLPILSRPARGAILSTWNTCSSMGLSLEPRTPRGTRPCTSAPSTIRSALQRPPRALLLTSASQPLCALCSFTISFIHSFSRYFLNTFPVSGSDLGAEDTVVIKTGSPSIKGHTLPLRSRVFRGRPPGIQVPVGAHIWAWPWGWGEGGSLEDVPAVLR